MLQGSRKEGNDMKKTSDSVTKYIMKKISEELTERCSTPEEIVEATLATLMVQNILESETLPELRYWTDAANKLNNLMCELSYFNRTAYLRVSEKIDRAEAIGLDDWRG